MRRCTVHTVLLLRTFLRYVCHTQARSQDKADAPPPLNRPANVGAHSSRPPTHPLPPTPPGGHLMPSSMSLAPAWPPQAPLNRVIIHVSLFRQQHAPGASMAATGSSLFLAPAWPPQQRVPGASMATSGFRQLEKTWMNAEVRPGSSWSSGDPRLTAGFVMNCAILLLVPVVVMNCAIWLLVPVVVMNCAIWLLVPVVVMNCAIWLLVPVVVMNCAILLLVPVVVMNCAIFLLVPVVVMNCAILLLVLVVVMNCAILLLVLAVYKRSIHHCHPGQPGPLIHTSLFSLL
eukprot:1137147-Pelagomonas_calceolata.AAC.5